MKKNNLWPYLLVAPVMLGIAVFYFYPFVINIVYSFLSGSILAGNLRFAGLKNYRYVLSDPIMRRSLYITLIWTVSVTAFQFFFGFSAALYCNTKMKIVKVLKPVFILPWAIPGIVATLAWRWMYNGDYGIINTMLYQAGFIRSYIGWLSDPNLVMISVIIVAVWKGFPFYLLMLFAGLQSIPLELFEAARIDGANAFQTFRNIIVPSLKTIISLSLTLGLIWTSNYFDGIYALTGGGPARMTETLPLYIYDTAFVYYRMNEAVIPAILLFAVCALLGMFYFNFRSKAEAETI